MTDGEKLVKAARDVKDWAEFRESMHTVMRDGGAHDNDAGKAVDSLRKPERDLIRNARQKDNDNVPTP